MVFQLRGAACGASPRCAEWPPEMTGAERPTMTAETIELEGGVLPIWPEGQRIGRRGNDRSLMRTDFPDVEAYHPRLIERIFEMERDPAFTKSYMKAIGGTKINHIERWGFPEADLVCARAMALFRHATDSATATVDLSWTNIYRDGAYAKIGRAHV